MERRHRSRRLEVLDLYNFNKRFELGSLPFKRNSATDWESIRTNAKQGKLDEIPPDVYVRCYNQLRRIMSDHVQPLPIEKTISVYWGRTGTGKSRLAWEQAGMDAYSKDPLNKWWDGYQDQKHVVIDEFRGIVGISHILRWFDRYPTRVESKGASLRLNAHSFWITSNLDPRNWYPELDQETRDALLRRLNITHFP